MIEFFNKMYLLSDMASCDWGFFNRLLNNYNIYIKYYVYN